MEILYLWAVGYTIYSLIWLISYFCVFPGIDYKYGNRQTNISVQLDFLKSVNLQVSFLGA